MSTPEEKFAALHASCGRGLLNYFRRRIAVECDAADLVAQTYLILWRRIGSVPDGTADARAWAYGVARGVLSNYSRGVRRRLALADRLRSELESSAAQAPNTAASAALELLDRLDPVDRDLLTLTLWDGLTLHEAAVAVGMNDSTARVHVHRARKRLRQLRDTQHSDAIMSEMTE